MSSASASAVSGPLAMITGPCGIAFTSSWTISTRGCARSVFVIQAEKPSRSTASALPAGTRCRSALFMIRESSMRISSLSTPTALSRASLRSEFEQTSSAKSAL